MPCDDDADLGPLDGRTVAIIGFGSQGSVHALNLRDSGVDVIVGVREGSGSVEQALSEGLKVASIVEAASFGDIVTMLIPDEHHSEVWQRHVREAMVPGDLLMFGHGFSVHNGKVKPSVHVDVAMVALKGPGHIARRRFLEGHGVHAVVAVHQDVTGQAKPLALAYAKALGCARAGVIEATFAEETETDLFSLLGP